MRGHSSITEKHMILDGVLPAFKKVSQAPSRLPSGVVYDLRHAAAMTAADWEWVQAEQDRRYKAIDELGRVWLVQNPIVRPWALLGREAGGLADEPGADRGKVYIRPAPPRLALTAEQARAQASLATAHGGGGGEDGGFGSGW